MISAASRKKKTLLLSVSGVTITIYGYIDKLGEFCETFVEVANYVIAFCETMWKHGATEI